MEWAENNYYKLLIPQQTAELVPVAPFWDDYARNDAQERRSCRATWVRRRATSPR